MRASRSRSRRCPANAAVEVDAVFELALTMADGGDSVTHQGRSTRSTPSRPPTGMPAPVRTIPFVSHAFLKALEDSGAVAAKTGWLPQHLVMEDATGQVIGCVPAYVKSHSYGEYVFDWGWAEAFERAGGRYYPKLQVSVPFSPVTGPRLLVRPGGDTDGASRRADRRADGGGEAGQGVLAAHHLSRPRTNGSCSARPG